MTELTGKYGHDRGSQYGEDTKKHDFYPTPIPLCETILKRHPVKDKPIHILDPGAGTGNWGRAWRNIHPDRKDIITGIEIRNITLTHAFNEYDEWITGDYLNFVNYGDRKYDLIMGNPPFRYAEEFIRKSWDLMPSYGQLVFLLKLTFLESRKRQIGLFKEYNPYLVSTLTRRVPFFRNKTGTTAYAVFLWIKSYSENLKISRPSTHMDWLYWENK